MYLCTTRKAKQTKNTTEMKKTKKAYEEYLNDFGESLGAEDFVICGKRRSGKYGKLVREYDPIGFEVGYREWKSGY